MPAIATSSVALRVGAPDFDPDEITEALGVKPTTSFRKGDNVLQSNGRERLRRGSLWILDTPDREPEAINDQILWLLAQTTKDIGKWKSLTEKYKVDIFCGLFMNVTDEGFSISPIVMDKLAYRGIFLQIRVYAPDESETTRTKSTSNAIRDRRETDA
jgi:Domain of unknown function (DUF4279)